MAYSNAPTYVKIGLWGVGSRGAATSYLVLSVVLTLGLAYYMKHPFALGMFIASLWYVAAIRWMDANDGWRTK